MDYSVKIIIGCHVSLRGPYKLAKSSNQLFPPFSFKLFLDLLARVGPHHNSLRILLIIQQEFYWTNPLDLLSQTLS